MDNQEFEQYHHQYYTASLKLCRSIVKNTDDALDLCQNTWIKILNAKTPYRDGEVKFATYFYVIAKRIFLDNCRKYKNVHLMSFHEHLEEHDEEAFHQDYIPFEEPSVELKVEVDSILSCLNPKLREAALCIMEGYTIPEIKARTGVPYSTSMFRIRRALRKK